MFPFAPTPIAPRCILSVSNEPDRPPVDLAAETVPLNLLDRVLLLGHRQLRRYGLPGLPIQIHVWFRGRLDLAQLQSAVDRLVERWPLLTARLVEKPTLAWRPTGAHTLKIRRMTLESDREEDVLSIAEQLLAEPFDLAHEDPARLVVQHRPGGDDVLTFQFSHSLMDGHGGIALLNELVHRPEGSLPAPWGELSELEKELLSEATGQGWWQSLQSVKRLGGQGRPVALPFTKHVANPSGGRFLLRWVDERATLELQERLARINILANISVAFVASGFRTLNRHLHQPLGRRSIFETFIPHNIPTRRKDRQIFHNLFSRVTLAAWPHELADRDELVRLLTLQWREGCTEEAARAGLTALRILVKLSRWLPWLFLVLRPPPISLLVLYWGEWVKSGQSALGATIERSFINSICIAPPGFSANISKVDERLLVCFQYSPYALSDDAARQLLDDWLDDLLAA